MLFEVAKSIVNAVCTDLSMVIVKSAVPTSSFTVTPVIEITAESSFVIVPIAEASAKVIAEPGALTGAILLRFTKNVSSNSTFSSPLIVTSIVWVSPAVPVKVKVPELTT